MTHPSKRYLIYIPIGLSILLCISYAAVLLYYLLNGDLAQLFDSAKQHIAGGNARTVLLVLLIQSAYAAAAILVLFLFFRKTHSSEVFFFLFGLLGVSIQTTRFFVAPASLVTLSAYSLIPFTRLVYFGRLCTTLSFFTSGLFATGFTSQRREFYLSLILLISFIIAATLPVDFTSTEGPLLFQTGEKTGFTLAYYAINLFTVLNFILAAYKHSEPMYWYVAGAVLLVIAGIEISFFLPYGLGAAAGVTMAIAGTVLFANRTHEIYLWI
jgi:hypothetical protein